MNMAEREGFEPSVEFPLQHLSRVPPSASRPPLRIFNDRLKSSVKLIPGPAGVKIFKPGRLPPASGNSLLLLLLQFLEISQAEFQAILLDVSRDVRDSEPLGPD